MKKKFISLILSTTILANVFTLSFAAELDNINEEENPTTVQEEIINEDNPGEIEDTSKDEDYIKDISNISEEGFTSYGIDVDNSIDEDSELDLFLNSNDTIKRIAGSNRVETAVLISQFENNISEKVIIADSRKYADALSGSSLTFGEYPVLLVDENISDSVIEEIIRLEASEVIILGGISSVSSEIENTLNEIPSLESITRISGINRYETSSLINERSTNKNLVISSGENFPDALAASILTNTGASLLLTKGESLSYEIINNLNGYYRDNISIVGGTTTIKESVVDEVKKLSNLNNIQRIYDSNRFSTSVKIANTVDVSDTLLIASGENFPDALAASTLSQKLDAPILLVSKNIIDDSVIDYIKDNDFTKAIVLGGNNSISDNTLNNINRLLNGDDVIDNTNPITLSGYVVAKGKQDVFYTGNYDSDIVGTIKDRQIVEVLDQNYSWVKINYDKTTGWVEKKFFSAYSAKSFGKVVNDVPYISQLKPVYAPNGCEPTSLLMGLQGKGYTKIGLRQFLDNMPKHSSNPEKGYVGIPYNSVNHIFQTIDPAALTKYGQKYGNVVNSQGCSGDDIVREVQNGNTVVVWVTLFWQKPYYRTLPIEGKNTTRIWNNHVLLVTGYDPKTDSFYIADPYNHEGAGASRSKPFYYWKSKSLVEDLHSYRKFAVTVR